MQVKSQKLIKKYPALDRILAELDRAAQMVRAIKWKQSAQ